MLNKKLTIFLSTLCLACGIGAVSAKATTLPQNPNIESTKIHQQLSEKSYYFYNQFPVNMTLQPGESRYLATLSTIWADSYLASENLSFTPTTGLLKVTLTVNDISSDVFLRNGFSNTLLLDAAEGSGYVMIQNLTGEPVTISGNLGLAKFM